MKYELVKRKVSDLKPDLNQPRKSFKQKDINLLAQTYRSQGIINPIEIDAENVIITGEMRWRASKIAELEEIDCKLLINITEKEKRERQIIENEHNQKLTPKEREDAINYLWEIGDYITQGKLGDLLGISGGRISEIIKAKKTRDSLKESIPKSISTSRIPSKTMTEIGAMNKNDQIKIIKKVEIENIPNFEVRKLVTEIKKLPKEVKEEVLKPKSKITIEDAKEIAEIKKPEMREEAIKFVKKQKIEQERTKEYIMKVAKEEIPMSTKVINLDQKVIDQFLEVKKKVFIKMHIRNVASYNEHTQTKLKRIMKEILEYLQQQLKIEGEIVNV